MIEYKIYRESDGTSWDNFVDSTKDSTIFHSQQFLRYHIDREFPNHSLMFYKKNMLIAVFSASAVGNTLFSHPGASFGGFVFQMIGLDGITPAVSAFLTSLYVIFTALIVVVWKKYVPTYTILFGILLATFGAGYIQGPPELHFDLEEWLTVLCALMFAGHIIATDVVTKRSSPIAVTFTSILLSALICFLVSIVYVSLNPGELQIIGLLTDSKFLIPLILTAVFGTFIALTLVNYFQKLLDPVRASVLYALEPVWATILAIGFGMEKFTLWLILGGSALVVGNIIAEIGTYKAVK